MSYTEKQYWVVECTREDGSTFLLSGNDATVAHFHDRKRCTEFKSKASCYIDGRRLRARKAVIRVEVVR